MASERLTEAVARWRSEGRMCPVCDMFPLEGGEDHAECRGCDKWFFKTSAGYWQEAS